MLQRQSTLHQNVGGLPMPDQVLHSSFLDSAAPAMSRTAAPNFQRVFAFGFPIVFAVLIGSILSSGFWGNGAPSIAQITLTILMIFLAAWEAIPTATAILGLISKPKKKPSKPVKKLSVAILVTIRDDAIEDVMRSKISLLDALHKQHEHDFTLHVLSDSQKPESLHAERRFFYATTRAFLFYNHRKHNTDFKSGNIRNWIENYGALYDAFITLDADSELTAYAVLELSNQLSADPACALIQTIPTVRCGSTVWQYMQSMASRLYGGLQGRGLAQWMGNEANYYGHNAIVRTQAFATCAGLPHITGRGLWNGVIMSHDFVEAALLRRAGWSVRILPLNTASFEQAPSDVIAHLKRDARWCRGNLQHGRILTAANLHSVSRFHVLAGIFTYLSSVMWLAVFMLWASLEITQDGFGGPFALSALLLITINLLLPRVLAVCDADRKGEAFAKATLETVFSTAFAPSFMVQRVMFILKTLANRPALWLPHDCRKKSFFDFLAFHIVEWIFGLGLLAMIEQGRLSLWFLPMAACLVMTPFLSSLSAQTFTTTLKRSPYEDA